MTAARGPALRGLLAVGLLLLGGCATIEPRPLAPSLFPPAASAPALRDAAGIVLTVADPEQSFTNPPVRFRQAQVRLPIGRIVEAAARLALGEQFEHIGADTPGSGALAVRVSDVVPEVDSALIFVLPVPGGLIDRVDVTTRLSFKLAVLAPDGSARWSRDYDSGRELVQAQRVNVLMVEPLHDAIQRSLHEQAAGLMRRAAADLRGWLVQERRRERVL